MAGQGHGRGCGNRSTARLGNLRESTGGRENVMKQRNARFLASKADQNPMELLASPSRGMDTVVDSSMLGIHSNPPGISANLSQVEVQNEFRKFITEKIEKYSQRSPSCISLLDVAMPELMQGSPFVVVEMLKDHGRGSVRRARDELQEILLSIRKLREGIMSNARYDSLTIDVYELSVLVSILCGDVSQLATSITRLNYDVYGNLGSKSTPDEKLCQTVQNLNALFHKEPIPVRPWLSTRNNQDPQDTRRRLFEAIWLMESLCSHRPEFLQEYLQRKASMRTKSNMDTETNVYLDFAQTAYHAVQRDDSMALRALLTGEPKNKIPPSLRSFGVMFDVFWLRVMAQGLVPRVRARSEYIVRRSYLRIPVRPEFKCMVYGEYAHLDNEATPSDDKNLHWVESVLLLDPDTTASITAGFQQPDPNIHRKTNIWRSYMMLAGIARQYGHDQWEQTRVYLKPRIVEGTQAFALNLRP